MNIEPIVAVFNGEKVGSAETLVLLDMLASDPLVVEAWPCTRRVDP
jgi:hypothetical protein